MNYNNYKKKAFEKNSNLKKEYENLELEYEIIKYFISTRIEKGITQKELAKLCRIKQSNISRLESGRYNPSLKFLNKIADALDKDLIIELRERIADTKTNVKD